MSYEKERDQGQRKNPAEEEQNPAMSEAEREKECETPLTEQEGKGTKKQEEKFSFLQETIKPKTISREKLLKEFVRLAVYGVVLGVFACVGFCALKPWAQNWFKGNPKTVTIPEDEEPTEDEEDKEQEEQEAQPVFDAQSYEKMMASLYEKTEEAQKGVVSVSRATGGEDWNAEATGITESVSGIIAADNGQDILIFADDSICEEAKSWTATFADGSEHKADLKKRDKNTGFAMFGVPRGDISEATWNNVKVAVLGNSNLCTQGQTVIAVGNMFGYTDGVGYGIISSGSYKEKIRDGECGVLATDIAGAHGGTGVLFNLDGEVIGLLSSEIWADQEMQTAKAFAISDLKSIIELMANGNSVPYVGIYGTTVTGAIQKEDGMPSGVYVIDVDPDSPAMEAGIQSGDVIWQVAGESVSSMVAYQKAVLTTKAGEAVRFKGKRLGSDGYVDIDFTVTIGSKE